MRKHVAQIGILSLSFNSNLNKVLSHLILNCSANKSFKSPCGGLSGAVIGAENDRSVQL